MTMKLVFDAIGDQIRDNQFAILINKCSDAFRRKLVKKDFLEVFHSSCRQRKIKTTRYVHFAPAIRKLEDADEKTVPLDAETSSFLNHLPVAEIDSHKLQNVSIEDYEALLRKMDETTKQMDTMRKDAKAAKEEMRLVVAQVQQQQKEAQKKAQALTMKSSQKIGLEWMLAQMDLHNWLGSNNLIKGYTVSTMKAGEGKDKVYKIMAAKSNG